MKSRRMWSLLTAAALSGGVITFANVTPPIVAAAETMADQYQPYYDDSAVRAVPWVYLSPESETGLPYGTTFSLFDHESYDSTVFSEGAVMVSLSPDNGQLRVWFNSLMTPNPGITTTSFRMAAHYPDGSSEIFRVTLNLIPEDTHAHDAAYPDAYVRVGSRAEVVPFIRNHYGAQFPDGTSFSMTGYYEVDDRRAEGWTIELDSASGVLTVEIPEGAPESSVEVPVVVTYPDGSKDNISTTVFAEGPDDAELYTPSFEMMTVQAGTTGTTDSLAAGLPSDTGFYLSDLGPLSSFFDAGGSISISWDGSFTIDVPAIWTEDLAIPLFVLFPDGSSTTSNLEIDVIPADQNTIFDVQFEHYHLQAGTTGTIYGATDAALPPGTSIEMVEDENIDALRAAGWEFNVIDDLNISVAVPADATDGVNVNVNVTYPDGTSEIVAVDVLVNPLLAALYDVEYSEVVLNAGDSIYVTPDDAWGGWSYYASTSIDESPAFAALQDEGWSIEGNGYTGLYITAPQTATTSITLPLTIHYYDGSTEESQVRITVIPEKQAVLHEVTYPPAILLAGGSLTVFPENTDLPDGTLLLLSQDQNLDDARNAGWTIDNYLSGEFFITAPITATEGIQLTFQVVYPDGTFEHTTADI
ncbi:Rib/alpha-like domain-containing protein, partial [Corynebacterium faecale]